MGRKKLKLTRPIDTQSELKNYLRRLPCLIKKCDELSKKTCTKVFLLITDAAWENPLVYCSDYLDCFFASYEKSGDTVVKYEAIVRGPEELDLKAREVPKSTAPFYPFTFNSSYIPLSKRITKGEFYRRILDYPESNEEVVVGLPVFETANGQKSYVEKEKYRPKIGFSESYRKLNSVEKITDRQSKNIFENFVRNEEINEVCKEESNNESYTVESDGKFHIYRDILFE